jgi:hypothetical protein
MIKPISILLLHFLLIQAGSLLAAQALFPEPNWTRQQALEATARIDTTAELKTLFQLAREMRNEELLQELQAMKARQSLPDPARDQLLYSFALGLGDLPAWSVNHEVVDFMLSYEAQTLVPHEDRESVGVALFNIRAATAGSLNQWQRYSAWSEARQLLLHGSEPWLSGYLDAGFSQRQGFLDALESAPESRLEEIGAMALQGISGESSLTQVATRAGILLGDSVLFQQAVARGGGAELAASLRSAAGSFDEAEIESILKYSMVHARPEIASLAMAELAPKVLEQPPVTQMLFKTLEHRELGATAAMLLSSSKQPAVRQQLAELAAGPQSIASRRASLALGNSGNRPAEDEK